MSKGNPIQPVRLRPTEKAELKRLADKHAVTLSDAFRKGARMYLESREKAARAA